MMPFATEFPICNIQNSGKFVSQIISWLKGTKYSTVFDGAGQADFDAEATVLRSKNGEELRLRILNRDGNNHAIGFRHDFPDNEGRLWRTETVIRRYPGTNKQDIIRLRTQCIAMESGARLETPRKPYLIKSILREGWGGTDGLLNISNEPRWLIDDEQDYAVAQDITDGKATKYLPVIYISAISSLKWPIDEEKINKLSYDLGGIAHVVVEPDRNFSFRLRDITMGRNVYGGAIGVSLPTHGIVRKFFLGNQISAPRDLLTRLIEVASAYRSHLPAEGWDWTELQEQALRQHRERDRSRLTADENNALYEDEIRNLQEKISELKNQLIQQNIATTNQMDGEDFYSIISEQIGPEIYPGEFMDRLREAVKSRFIRADQDGLDKRSKSVLQKFSALPPSTGLSEFIEDLKRSTKDSNRIVQQLSDLLCRHGYQMKGQNKHVRLEPQAGFEGLDTITVPTTPSDTRALTNLRKQIERTLGLTKLSD